MAGKCYLEIGSCKYKTRTSSSEDCPLVLLKGMPSNLRVYNSCICHAGLFYPVDDSLFKKKVHSRFDSTRFAQNERTQVDVYDSLTS